MNSQIVIDLLIIWNNTGVEIIAGTIAALRMLRLNAGCRMILIECLACIIISFILSALLSYYHYAKQFSSACGLLVGLLGTKKMVRILVFLIHKKFR